ncbi:MAG: sulfotransferase [Actinomycetota bacterium]|nr:sulfotransferase [Actinomycetota bacterium]
MVSEVLVRHPDIGFISNVDAYLPFNARGRWNSSLYRRTPPQLGQRDRMGLQLIQKRMHFGPSEAYNRFSREVSPLVSRPWRDLTAEDASPWLAARFRAFFEERAEAQRKPAFLHKFTGWPRTGFIHEVIPDAKFLHVVRDGRAVASSLIQRPHWHGYLGPWGWGHGPLPEEYQKEWESSGYSFVGLAALDWKLMMDAFVEAKKRIPPQLWMEMRYEDFIEQPRQRTQNILDFMGVPWTGKFEGAFRKYSFSKSRKTGYRRDLTPQQLELVQTLLEDHLSRFGYGKDAERFATT